MTGYLTSVKWPSMSLRPWSTSAGSGGAGSDASERATDAKLTELPAHEARALDVLRSQVAQIFEKEHEKLGGNDGWRAFHSQDADDMTRRDEMLLRVLRYNLLNVSKASLQIKQTLEWRVTENVSMKSLDVLNGAIIGLPAAKMCLSKKNDQLLVICIAEAYVRREVDHEKQFVGVAKLFDHFFYDEQGPLAKSVTAVVDFTNMSAKNVDLIGMKNGINIYMNHFPEVFHKIFLLNYPRFIHGGTFLYMSHGL